MSVRIKIDMEASGGKGRWFGRDRDSRDWLESYISRLMFGLKLEMLYSTTAGRWEFNKRPGVSKGPLGQHGCADGVEKLAGNKVTKCGLGKMSIIHQLRL